MKSTSISLGNYFDQFVANQKSMQPYKYNNKGSMAIIGKKSSS
jgi:NADH dehydrogenase FAD-containing subunit